ncbi:MAG: HEPN domain-containing protein [bacterium]|nr:HEPN domain-containing protein [bacterium]
MGKRQLDLSHYRMEKAKEDLSSSKLNLDDKKFSPSINRSYYAMFHAVRALFALEKFDSKKHSGIISHFNQFYIKPRHIDPEYFKMLTGAFQIRKDCDYDDFYIATLEDAGTQYENACKFIKAIEEYIKTILTGQQE